MTEQVAKQRMREASIAAVVVRADGSREELGVVSYWHRNPLKRWAFSIKRKVSELWPRS